MPNPTHEDVLNRRRELTLSGDADGLVELYAPEAVIEMPFAGTPGSPARLEGRDAIKAHTRRVMASPLRLISYEVVECYQTQDPELVVVEMRSEVTFGAGDRSVVAESIQVLRIRDGRILQFRDFANPAIYAELVDGLHVTAAELPAD